MKKSAELPSDPTDTPEPVLPYAGTSGSSGGGSSARRAARRDADGSTAEVQNLAFSLVAKAEAWGMTAKEFDAILGKDHSNSSSSLSTLHMAGKIARLSRERNGGGIYVLPIYVGEQVTVLHGSEKKKIRRRAEIAEVLSDAWHRVDRSERGGGLDLSAAKRALEAVAAEHGIDPLVAEHDRDTGLDTAA